MPDFTVVHEDVGAGDASQRPATHVAGAPCARLTEPWLPPCLRLHDGSLSSSSSPRQPPDNQKSPTMIAGERNQLRPTRKSANRSVNVPSCQPGRESSDQARTADLRDGSTAQGTFTRRWPPAPHGSNHDQQCDDRRSRSRSHQWRMSLEGTCKATRRISSGSMPSLCKVRVAPMVPMNTSTHGEKPWETMSTTILITASTSGLPGASCFIVTSPSGQPVGGCAAHFSQPGCPRVATFPAGRLAAVAPRSLNAGIRMSKYSLSVRR